MNNLDFFKHIFISLILSSGDTLKQRVLADDSADASISKNTHIFANNLVITEKRKTF